LHARNIEEISGNFPRFESRFQDYNMPQRYSHRQTNQGYFNAFPLKSHIALNSNSKVQVY